ncbi:uncharacterized protein Z518_08157 [Rhinocladiella mackenziei CBS 650.93]|uniref:BHLH domain-containing protein n=1 Tax=Rhinocladiella mackenziei CBS 650.93 TaxID=1442369 RepID=A0A0D2GVA3_9EURO|nr:uncharacterized protein Z518_08157 [Rhinocladiella mackenziei CBS 650.93]KIX02218.1 hypothetical protein Z518_08157 [Rhinocladiella mackenziei CBS 650.93]
MDSPNTNTKYQEPFLQQSDDESLFLPPTSIDVENYQNLDQFDPWQGLQSADYLIFPALDSANAGSRPDLVEDASPEAFVAPSKTTCAVDSHRCFVLDKLGPADITSRQASSVGQLDCGASARETPLPMVNLADIEDCSLAPCISKGRASPVRSSRPQGQAQGQSRKQPKDEKQPRSTRSRGRKTQPHSHFSSADDSATLRAKHNHSVVERRYRDNLNGKITQLHRTLLATEANPHLANYKSQILAPFQDGASRVRKYDIMTKAINYVHQSEVEIRHMTDEIRHLQERIYGLEKLVKCEDCTVLQNIMQLQLGEAC